MINKRRFAPVNDDQSTIPDSRNGEATKHHVEELLHGSAVAGFFRVLGAGASFLFTLVVARVLGASDAGQFFLAFTIVTVTATVGRFGLDNAVLRFVAAHSSLKDWGGVRDLYIKSLIIILAGSGVISIVLFLAAPILADRVFGKEGLAPLLLAMGAAVIPISLLVLHGLALQGAGRIKSALFGQMVAPFAFAIAIMAFLPKSYGPTGAVLAYVFGVAVGLMFCLRQWYGLMRAVSGTSAVFQNAILMRTGGRLLSISILQMTIVWSPTLMLGVWGSAGDVGVYSAAFRVSLLVSFVVSAVNIIAAPKFASLFARGDLRSLERVARTSATVGLCVSGPILLGVLMAPGWVMGLFGPEFRIGSALLVIMAIGEFVNAATGSVGYLLLMTGNERSYNANLAFSATFCVMLCLVLVPRFGAMGAAISTCMAGIVANLLSTYFASARLGINTLPVMALFRVQDRGCR